MGRSRVLRPFDVWLPAAIAVVGAVALVNLRPPGMLPAIGLEWAACALLVWRRRWTIPACTAAGVLATSLPWVGPELDQPAAPILVLAVAGFSLARYVGTRRGAIGLAAFVLALLPDYLVTVDEPLSFADVVFVGALLLPPYVFGRLVRALAERNDRLAEQAERLIERQATVRHEAVESERARIARELHDVIAHSMSAMVVQAAVARDLVHTDPDRATAALDEVASAGRSALAETGRLLHLIRDTDDELGLGPSLGLDRLPELVNGFRRSGLDVAVDVDGSLHDLPAGVDVSGYRIVQEALTNARKYAADGAASLQLLRTPTALVITAENRMAAANGHHEGSGLGLVGMAERVSVFGGRLTHGRTVDGCWRLDASLPLGGG